MSTYFDIVKFVRRMFGCKDRVTSDGRTIGEIAADIISDGFGKTATVWDGFIGSAYCGMVFKRKGMKVISSDVRPSSWLRAAAFVGANVPAIVPEKIEIIAKALPKEGWFIANEAPLIGVSNAGWLDALVSILPTLAMEERIAATLGVVWATETFLQKGSRFLHMHRSWNGETLCGGWHMRDKDLAAEWRRFMLDDYPLLVLHNDQENPCLYGDAVELAAGIKADAAYFDPPYSGLFSNYQGSYDLVDDWTKSLLGKEMPPEPPGQPHRRFSSPDNAIPSLALLMDGAKHIPLWIISYSDSDTMRVTPEDIASLAEIEGRSVEILRFPFRQSGTKKLAIPKTFNECLIICRDGTKGGGRIAVPSSIEGNVNDIGKGNILGSGKEEADDEGNARTQGINTLTCAGFFDGIGGNRMAFEIAGFKWVYSCEWEKMARLTYEANFGEAPAGCDIRKVKASEVPSHNVLSCGFPCVSFSVSGNRRGFDDPRATVVLDALRIAAQLRPMALFIENANTLVTNREGKDFEFLLARIDEAGYRTFWKILDARHYGLPSARKRAYLCCFRKDLDIVGFDFPEPTMEKVCIGDIMLPDRVTKDYRVKHDGMTIKEGAIAKSELMRGLPEVPRIGWLGDYPPSQEDRIYSPAGKGATITARTGGKGGQSGLYLVNGEVRRLHPRECARALGFGDGFLLPVSDDEAYRLIGNSVAIPVVALIAKGIAKKLVSHLDIERAVMKKQKNKGRWL